MTAPGNQPPVDEQTPLGDHSAEHARLRLECLRQATEQARHTTDGFGDILYRARHNARFVLFGETPRLRSLAEVQVAASPEGRGND